METYTLQHRQCTRHYRRSICEKTATEARIIKPLDVVLRVVFRMFFSSNDEPSLTAGTVEYHVVVHV